VKDCGRSELEPLSVFLDDGVVPRSSRNDNHNQLGEDLGRYLVVQPGDIVFNKLRTWQGGLGVSKYTGIVSPAYFVCRPNEDYEPRFLHYLLRSTIYLRELTRISKWQPPAQFDIGWEQLRGVQISTPSKERQIAIADYLDTETARIDALIEKKQRMIALARLRETALLEKVLLLEGVASDTARFEGEWSALLPEDWGVSPVKHLAECLNSGAWGDEPGVLEVDLPVATTAQINADGEFHITDMAIRSFERSEASKYLCRPGDIVIVKSSGSATNIISGKAGLVHPEHPSFIFSNFLMRLRPRVDLIEPRFLYLALVSYLTRQRIERMVSATTYPNLQVGEYLSARMPVPPLGVQRSLVTKFDSEASRLRSLRHSMQHSVELLKERRQALITSAVTGEVAIPGVAA